MSVQFPGGSTLPTTLPERALFVHTPAEGDPRLYTGPTGGGAPVAVSSGWTPWACTVLVATDGGVTATLPPGVTVAYSAGDAVPVLTFTHPGYSIAPGVCPALLGADEFSFASHLPLLIIGSDGFLLTPEPVYDQTIFFTLWTQPA